MNDDKPQAGDIIETHSRYWVRSTKAASFEYMVTTPLSSSLTNTSGFACHVYRSNELPAKESDHAQALQVFHDRVITEVDILVFNYGVHYHRFRAKNNQEVDIYERDMRSILTLLFDNRHKLDVIAFRETSAQSFDNVGGEYDRPPGGSRISRKKTKCFGALPCAAVPMNDTVIGWRDRIVRRVAEEIGFDVVTSDESSLLEKQSAKHGDDKILFILPFLDFSRQQVALMKGVGARGTSDCTHFCFTPFLWFPLWRSLLLTFAFEYGINE